VPFTRDRSEPSRPSAGPDGLCRDPSSPCSPKHAARSTLHDIRPPGRRIAALPLNSSGTDILVCQARLARPALLFLPLHGSRGTDHGSRPFPQCPSHASGCIRMHQRPRTRGWMPPGSSQRHPPCLRPRRPWLPALCSLTLSQAQRTIPATLSHFSECIDCTDDEATQLFPSSAARSDVVWRESLAFRTHHCGVVTLHGGPCPLCLSHGASPPC